MQLLYTKNNHKVCAKMNIFYSKKTKQYLQNANKTLFIIGTITQYMQKPNNGINMKLILILLLCGNNMKIILIPLLGFCIFWVIVPIKISVLFAVFIYCTAIWHIQCGQFSTILHAYSTTLYNYFNSSFTFF